MTTVNKLDLYYCVVACPPLSWNFCYLKGSRLLIYPVVITLALGYIFKRRSSGVTIGHPVLCRDFRQTLYLGNHVHLLFFS